MSFKAKISQLSPQDAQFLYMETNKNQSHITVVNIFDPSTAENSPVRFKQIIEHVETRLHTSPIYKRRLKHVPMGIDYPYWVEDEDFDIEYHIRHSRLPDPGNWRQLCIFLSRYHSRPLDMNRPPWEMFVVEGLGRVEGYPEGSYAVATKVHHAAADGAALINFFGGLYDINAAGKPLMKINDINEERYRSPSPLEVTTRSWMNTIRSPFKVTDTLMQTAPKMIRSVHQNFKRVSEQKRRKDEGVPLTRFNTPTSAHKVFDGTSFELSEFVKIRSLCEGSTVNDVVLALCSGALRRYLNHHHELPIQSLRAIVPVNERPTKQQITADSAPGNNISNMFVVLHTDIEDPEDRLKAIHETTQSLKEKKVGLPVRVMTDVTRHIPASTQILASRLIMSSSRMTNLVITNVPGPQVPVYMNGAKIVSQFGLAPLADNMGLIIGTPSYNGRISFSVTSSRDTMPDCRFFIECAEEAYKELLALAERKTSEQAKSEIKKTVKKKAPPKAKKLKAAPKKSSTKETTIRAKAEALSSDK